MANPRQRRKSRSSSHKPVSHSLRAKRNLKKTPPIRGPKVLQDAWDHCKTVKQNYAAIGLLHSLQPMTAGGVEHGRDGHPAPSSNTSPPPPSSSTVPEGFGKIIRDESGNVVDIELRETSDTIHSEQQLLGQELEKDLLEKWTTNLGGIPNQNPLDDQGKRVIKTLEQMSSFKHDISTFLPPLSGVGPRHASSGEVAYLQRLIEKHGDDLEAMSRDRRLNPDQRTVGELRRALKRALLV